MSVGTIGPCLVRLGTNRRVDVHHRRRLEPVTADHRSLSRSRDQSRCEETVGIPHGGSIRRLATFTGTPNISGPGLTRHVTPEKSNVINAILDEEVYATAPPNLRATTRQRLAV